MRKTILLAATALILSGLAAGVVGNNASGDVTIMGGGSSASASASVSANGTEYRAEVSMTGRSQTATDNAVSNISFSENEKKKVSFQGRITAPTPCHVIEHEVEGGNNNTYTMNIKTVKESLDNQSVCAQVMTGINYNASFQTSETFTGETFTLEIQHDGETVETIRRPEWVSEPREEVPDPGENQGGILGGLFNWLGGLL